MAVASNPLLQIGTPVGASNKAQATPVGSPSKVADSTKDGASSFAQVYAKEHKALPGKASAVVTARPAAHLAANDKKPAVSERVNVDKPSVAENGKQPSVSHTDKNDNTDKAAKKDSVKDRGDVQTKDTDSGDDTKEVAGKAEDNAAAPVDVTEDPALAVALAPADTAAQAAPATAVPVAIDPAQLPQPLVDPAQLQAAVQTPPATADEDFDPAADPLADLPMVRLALEQSAKDQGTTSVHAQAEPATPQAPVDPAASSAFADELGAAQAQRVVAEDDSDSGGAIGELKAGQVGEAGPAHGDDLTSGLNQLNQAVAGKSATGAAPPAQPLNMQQNGWSEGLVNRVMYLSSQNLKSADIQLHPLELGRLDIRVDVTADQQTQVTFHSAHLGVRDALESQQNRLRDMLAQQGLTQVDVSVSDQSRQSQHQQQQAQAQASHGSGRQGQGGSAGDDAEVSAVAEAAASQAVIGSSLVDYYA